MELFAPRAQVLIFANTPDEMELEGAKRKADNVRNYDGDGGDQYSVNTPKKAIRAIGLRRAKRDIRRAFRPIQFCGLRNHDVGAYDCRGTANYVREKI